MPSGSAPAAVPARTPPGEAARPGRELTTCRLLGPAQSKGRSLDGSQRATSLMYVPHVIPSPNRCRVAGWRWRPGAWLSNMKTIVRTTLHTPLHSPRGLTIQFPNRILWLALGPYKQWNWKIVDHIWSRRSAVTRIRRSPSRLARTNSTSFKDARAVEHFLKKQSEPPQCHRPTARLPPSAYSGGGS